MFLRIFPLLNLCFSITLSWSQTGGKYIRADIQDSVLLINGDTVNDDNIFDYFKSKFGKPNRKKGKMLIYDHLGITLLPESDAVRVTFYYEKVTSENPIKNFNGRLMINGHVMDRIYSFNFLKVLLYPCNFTLIVARQFKGTFFTFSKSLNGTYLSQISFHFIKNPANRQPYKVE